MGCFLRVFWARLMNLNRKGIPVATEESPERSSDRIEALPGQPATPPHSGDGLSSAALALRLKWVALAGSLLTLVVVIGAFLVGRSVGFTAGEDEATAELQASQAAEQASVEEARSTVLADSLSSCQVPESDDAALGDGGTSLSLESEGEDDFSGLGDEDLFCVLNELKIPDRVEQDMFNTTSMDGRREASWEGLTVSWSYHPDRGMDTIVYLDE